MAYDEKLASRIRTILSEVDGVGERRMFGGLSFLVNGNMCCGVLADRLVLRLGEDAGPDALALKHTSPMDFTGKPSRSMVFVSACGVAGDEELRSWVEQAVRFAGGLSPKTDPSGSARSRAGVSAL